MENTDEELTNDKTEEVEDYQLIDPNDLIIIDNPENWKPTEEMILSYAILLGYEPEKDPKEILEISEKYLTKKLPDNFRRAFMRRDYRILYIDMNTQEITLETEFETKAKEEFEECRKKYESKLNPPPIKKMINNTDEELRKKLEEQKKYNDSLRNSLGNIQIVDAPDEEEEKEDMKEEDKKEEEKTPLIKKSKEIKEISKKKNFDKEESSSEEIEPNKNNYKNNINNDNFSNKKEKQKNEEGEDFDDFFDASSKSSKDFNDSQKNIKSQNFNEKEDIEEKEEEKKEKRKNINNINDVNNNDDIINFRDISPKKENKIKSKEKYSNDNIVNNSYEDNFRNNKSNKKEDSKEKKEYLKKTKTNLEKYKNKLKKEYINKRNVFIENNIERITAKLKKKKSLEMSEVDLEELKNYEISLKQKMEQELNKYKKRLKSDYEYNILNQYNDLDTKQTLELKKNKLESDIRIQKERNKNKKENELKKNNDLIEKKKLQLEEIAQNKKSKLSFQNKNDINKLQKEFQENYEKYISDYKNNVFINIKDDLTNDTFINNLKDLEEEYINELNEKFEQEKMDMKYQLEFNLIKNLELYKIQAKNNIEQEIKKINDKINNLFNEYFNEKDLITKNFDIQKEKADSIINEKLKNISNIFLYGIKKKNSNKLNEEMEQINSIIKQNSSYNIEEDEIKVEEQLINKFVSKNSKLSEIKSMYDLAEKDYNLYKMKIEYISKAISIINKIIIEKGSDISFESNLDNKTDNKDDLLVIEMISTLKNKLEEFTIKNKDNMESKIYPFLNEEIDNFMNNMRKNKEKSIRMKDKFFYSKEIKLNNNIFIEDNPELKSREFPNSTNNSIKLRKEQKKSLSSDRYNNNYINNSMRENGNNSSNNNINETNLELSQEILNNFSEDILITYEKIQTFLKDESSRIEKEKQNLNKHDNMNNTLKNLKDSDNFKNYNKELNFILTQEQKTSRNNKTNIESKIRLFNKIKEYWRETVYFIYNNYSSPYDVKKRLNLLNQNINDYKNSYYSNDKETFERKGYNINPFRMNNSFMQNNNYNVIQSNNKNSFRYGGNNLRYSSFDKKYI